MKKRYEFYFWFSKNAVTLCLAAIIAFSSSVKRDSYLDYKLLRLSSSVMEINALKASRILEEDVNLGAELHPSSAQ